VLCCAVLCVQADIIQMCANAKVYNHPNTKPHKEADVIFKYSLKYVSTSAVPHVLETTARSCSRGPSVQHGHRVPTSHLLGFLGLIAPTASFVWALLCLDHPRSQTRMPLPLTAHAGEPNQAGGSLHDAAHQPLQSLHIDDASKSGGAAAAAGRRGSSAGTGGVGAGGDTLSVTT
jgi:hypothetical protein